MEFVRLTKDVVSIADVRAYSSSSVYSIDLASVFKKQYFVDSIRRHYDPKSLKGDRTSFKDLL